MEATEAIRRDLLALKLSSGKGAPYFADRISDANHTRVTINQRRLSRFIAGDVEKPDDEFLDWCEVYLKSLPAPPDPVFRLAQGLKAFCMARTDSDYTGRYRMTFLAIPDRTPDPSPAAEIKMTADDGFWRVEERFLQRRQIADGALVATPSCGVMITKDRLTQLTRLCVIAKEGVGNIGSLKNDGKALIVDSVGVDEGGSHMRSSFRLDRIDE